MGYNVFTLCLMFTLAVPLTVSVELYPPKPMGTLTIYDWSFTDEETTGKLRYNFKLFYVLSVRIVLQSPLIRMLTQEY